MAQATTSAEMTDRAVLNQDLYFEIKAAIRKAVRNDEYADLAGEPGYALKDILYTLEAAKEDVRELLGHEHQWGENDYCGTCGADGRA